MVCSFKDLKNLFMWSLPIYTSCLLSMSLNDIVDIEKADEICSLNFVVDDFSGLFLHPSICKLVSAIFYQIDNPSKTLKNVFYFI